MTESNFDELVARVKTAASHIDEVGAKKVDETIAMLMLHPDARCIQPLLLSLNDNARDDEGLFSIIHAAESFDNKRYVEELMVVMPELRTTSPRWASILLMRVLNNDSTKLILVQKLRTADVEVKEAIRWLCEKINERNPSFLAKTLPMLLSIKKY